MKAVPRVQALQRMKAVPRALLAPQRRTAKTHGSSKRMVHRLDKVLMLPNWLPVRPMSWSKPKTLAFPSWLIVSGGDKNSSCSDITHVVAVKTGQDEEDDRDWEDENVEFSESCSLLLWVNVNDSANLGDTINRALRVDLDGP
jgi:hypothetical protein